MNTQIKSILQKYWGHSAFRPLQEDIILSVLNGSDTLALLPTGGGKSVCFQVPALAMDGICIVISPLIALMKDQVEHLIAKGIKATAVFSGMTREEVDVALDNCIYGDIKFLYLSPERLLSDMVRERIAKMKVNLLAIDEAHCISQWGYDFRPPYLRISEIRELHPTVPVLALTATATPEVRLDIMKQLAFRKNNIFVKSFERKNLCYLCYHEEDKEGKLIEILRKVPGTAVVYVRSRKRTRELARLLVQNKISADFYNAGLASALRNSKQDMWMSGKIRVMVSTNAFGMGIDKPDVRTVVHMDLPDTPEAYYQEAGRAGRDEKTAFAVVLYNQTDVAELRIKQTQNFPEIKQIRRIYQALANYFQIPVDSGMGISHDFDITKFISTYELHPITTLSCLRILETEGLITVTDSVYIPSRIHFKMNHNDLYDFQVKNPRADNFIKTLLRSYEGLFDDFVKINEPELAKKTNSTYDEIVGLLQFLQQYGVISYQPRKDSPQLIFTAPREEVEYLDINEKTYLKRKEQYRIKTESMIRYVTSVHQCRSMMLLDYFGEKGLQRCGICDYCRSRNKLDMNEVEFENFKTLIQTILLKEKLTIEELLKKAKIKKNDDAVEAVRWLIDNEFVSFVDSDRLIWNSK